MPFLWGNNIVQCWFWIHCRLFEIISVFWSRRDYCRSPFCPRSPFFRGWVIFLKSRIDIFAAEKPKLGFYGIKTYTECSSFLNREKWPYTVYIRYRVRFSSYVSVFLWISQFFGYALLSSFACPPNPSWTFRIWNFIAIDPLFSPRNSPYTLVLILYA